MLCKDPATARGAGPELCVSVNRQRQAVEQEIYAQAIEMIETLPADDATPWSWPITSGTRG